MVTSFYGYGFYGKLAKWQTFEIWRRSASLLTNESCRATAQFQMCIIYWGCVVWTYLQDIKKLCSSVAQCYSVSQIWWCRHAKFSSSAAKSILNLVYMYTAVCSCWLPQDCTGQHSKFTMVVHVIRISKNIPPANRCNQTKRLLEGLLCTQLY